MYSEAMAYLLHAKKNCEEWLDVSEGRQKEYFKYQLFIIDRRIAEIDHVTHRFYAEGNIE